MLGPTFTAVLSLLAATPVAPTVGPALENSTPDATAPATAPGAISSPHTAPARQVFDWAWTDGSRATDRVFSKKKYGKVGNIPKFQLRMYPAYPPWRVKEYFWINGQWALQNVYRTDGRGRVSLTFDPRGPDGEWKDVTWIVRTRIIDISTTRSASPAPTTSITGPLLTVRYVTR